MYDCNNGFAEGLIAGQNSATNRNDGMFGGAWEGIWGIIILAMVFGWGNGGWGGFGGNNGAAGLQGAVTRADLCSEFNFNNLESAVRGVQQGICDSTFALNNTVVNGFNNVARDMCTGFANVAAGLNENRFAAQQCCCDTLRAIDNSRFDTQTGFTALGNQLASCCCETQRLIERGIADTNYNMATNTCAITTQMANNTRDIIDSQNAGTRAILDYLCQEKISDLQNENQSLKLAASQAAQNTLLTGAMVEQTNHLINRIAPYPTPSFQVAPPYYVGGYGAYGYNNNYGCGCGNCGGCGNCCN